MLYVNYISIKLEEKSEIEKKRNTEQHSSNPGKKKNRNKNIEDSYMSTIPQ